MKKIIMILATVALVSVFGIPVFAAQEMREGLWEMTTVTEMPGMPFKMAPTTIKHCYTKKDVKDRQNIVMERKNDCKMTEMKVSGNKMTWKMKCTGEGAGTFSGVTIFNRDSYKSTMKMNSQGMNMTTKVDAKRIGDCP